MNARSIFSKFFIIVCGISCLVQISGLCQDYFAYRTVTVLTVLTPTDIGDVALSFCPRYIDIMDYDRYEKDHNVTFPDHHNIFSADHVNDLQSRFTISEIFDYTPPLDKVFERCYVRKAGSYEMLMRRFADCYQFLNVKKYYHQEFMCYKFSIRSPEERHFFENSAYAINFPGVHYLVVFDQKHFENTSNVKFIAHDAYHEMPFLSSAYAPYFVRRHENVFINPQIIPNFFRIAYSKVTIHSLPHPYITNCKQYEKVSINSGNQCINQCMLNGSTELFDKIPFTAFIVDKYDYKHIVNDDIRNTTFAKELGALEKTCKDKCGVVYCNDNFKITYVDAEMYKPPLRISIQMPANYELLVEHRPSFVLNEFLLLALSCIGTWFGVSFMSLNPFNLKLIINRERECKHKRLKVVRISRFEEWRRLKKVESQLKVITKLLSLRRAPVSKFNKYAEVD